MPSLSEDLSQLESTLTAALSELESMKEKVRRLETENALLIQKLSPYSDEKTPQEASKPSTAVHKTASDGREALFKLYAEGYHVCHPAFGQQRSNNEDCLYCLGVLNDEETR